MHLLFPGRHHLLTNFQRDYLLAAAQGGELRDVNGALLSTPPIARLIWAVTSANHWNTRRNPLPGHRREAAIERFATDLPLVSEVYLIDDLGETPRFAEYVLQKIEVASYGRLRLHPANTILGCSTPAVIAMYEQLGFRVLPFELLDRQTGEMSHDTPWQVLQRLVEVVEAGDDWRTEAGLRKSISAATRSLYERYGMAEQIAELHRGTLLTEDGDLTESRDYNTYVRAFDEGAARKYELVRELVQPGRIVDIGCCTGAVLGEMTRDDRLRESDFFGVEAARPLYVECLHRKEQGAFANDHVFFYQRDFAAGPMFPDHSVNTFTTFSLTHEIESYAGREALLRFFGLLQRQLAPGGRWLNVDVVGPEEGDREVFLWLNPDDGTRRPAWDWSAATEAGPRPEEALRETLRNRLQELSTRSRFEQFALDFRRPYGESLPHRWETVAGREYAVLTLRDACEFLTKKDYVDNWRSEMHERFCFWSESQWRAAAEEHGFRVREGTRSFTNPWIAENRWRNKIALFSREAGRWTSLPDPPTTLVLAAEADW